MRTGNVVLGDRVDVMQQTFLSAAKYGIRQGSRLRNGTFASAPWSALLVVGGGTSSGFCTSPPLPSIRCLLGDMSRAKLADISCLCSSSVCIAGVSQGPSEQGYKKYGRHKFALLTSWHSQRVTMPMPIFTDQHN